MSCLRVSLSKNVPSLLVVAAIMQVQLTDELPGQSLHAVIDQHIEKAAGGPLSPIADDAEFLRRVYLDFTGNIPTADEARKFLADKNKAKRTKLIDRLLTSNEYPRRMQEAMSAMLLERRVDAKVPDAEWTKYLRDSFASNKAWDKLVSELLFSEPGEDKKPKPPAKFFLVSGRADMHLKTQDVARIFLGRDIQCAQCHDHPSVGDYSQSDYFGLFTYLQETPDKGITEFESVFVPGKKTTGPRLPSGEEVKLPTFEKGQEEEAKKHRPRLLLSSALPTKDNPLFMRNSVNRFWFLMMGRGLVHPLELHHSSNLPSHPKLLDALAADFSKSGFDIKRLLREIALSKAYQRSSRLPDGVDEKDSKPQTYQSAIGKPLAPEQMAWSVMQATGNLQAFLKATVPEKSEFTYKNYLNGLIDKAPENVPDAMKLFVGVFGNPPGEAEVEFNPAMGHALFLMNEPLILDWLKPKNGNLVERLSKISDASKVAEELYLSVLTRMPDKEEVATVASYLDRFKDRRVDALGELAWALIASSEFRSNH